MGPVEHRQVAYWSVRVNVDSKKNAWKILDKAGGCGLGGVCDQINEIQVLKAWGVLC